MYRIHPVLKIASCTDELNEYIYGTLSNTLMVPRCSIPAVKHFGAPFHLADITLMQEPRHV
jgi:hypothetical protein